MNTKIILSFKNLLISIFGNQKLYFYKKRIYDGSYSDLLEEINIISRIETDKGIIISEDYRGSLPENHYFLPPYLIPYLFDKRVLDNIYTGQIDGVPLTSDEIASIRTVYELLKGSKRLKEPNDNSEFSNRLIGLMAQK